MRKGGKHFCKSATIGRNIIEIALGRRQSRVETFFWVSRSWRVNNVNLRPESSPCKSPLHKYRLCVSWGNINCIFSALSGEASGASTAVNRNKWTGKLSVGTISVSDCDLSVAGMEYSRKSDYLLSVMDLLFIKQCEEGSSVCQARERHKLQLSPINVLRPLKL